MTTNNLLVFVRHGEKPEKDEHAGQLTCKGLNRASALFSVLSKKFKVDKPDYLFAPTPKQRCLDGGGQYSYTRPLVTITPIPIQAKMPVHTEFDVAEVGNLAKELRGAKYAESCVWVVWEHKELVELVRAIVKLNRGDPSIVPDWCESDFDSIYVVRITDSEGTKSVSFCHDHENLTDTLSCKCPDTGFA